MLGYRTLHEAEQARLTLPHLDCADLSPGWFRAFDDLDAITCCHYWRLILDAHLDTKVILTVRDIEAWWRSMVAHLERFHTGGAGWDARRIEEADRTHCHLFGAPWPLRGLYVEKYRQHELLVRWHCERNGRQLLVYDVTHGWESLCGFLSKPVPDAKFPWLNRHATPAVMPAEMCGGNKDECVPEETDGLQVSG